MGKGKVGPRGKENLAYQRDRKKKKRREGKDDSLLLYKAVERLTYSGNRVANLRSLMCQRRSNLSSKLDKREERMEDIFFTKSNRRSKICRKMKGENVMSGATI